jgi:hypothetical protein
VVGCAAVIRVVQRFECVRPSIVASAVIWCSASLAALYGSLVKSSLLSFLRRCSKKFLLIFWWPATIRINACITDFLNFVNYSLLLKLDEMLDLKLPEFGKLFIELRHYFQPLSDKMTVQRSCAQGLDNLTNDLFI